MVVTGVWGWGLGDGPCMQPIYMHTIHTPCMLGTTPLGLVGHCSINQQHAHLVMENKQQQRPALNATTIDRNKNKSLYQQPLGPRVARLSTATCLPAWLLAQRNELTIWLACSSLCTYTQYHVRARTQYVATYAHV